MLSSVNGRVFGEALFSQADIHAPWGGVVPNLAMEAHKSAMDKAVEQALSTAGVTADQLEAVAVTQGPGLGMCLKVHSLPQTASAVWSSEKPVRPCLLCISLHALMYEPVCKCLTGTNVSG